MPSTDTVTAKLTPGEFVIKKSAVDILGVPLLRKLNNLPDEGGHDNIDKLLSMAALEDAKPMMGGGVTTPNGVMGYENGGLTIRRGESMPPADPQYQMLASSMQKRPREYYDERPYNEVQRDLMPQYKEFAEATGNQFGFPEDILINKLNRASSDYGRAVGTDPMKHYNPFFAVQQWAKRVDPEGEFQEGDKKDEVAFRKFKRAYSDYIGEAEKSSVKMGRMVYDANRGQALRGGSPTWEDKKRQPLKDLNKSADKLTRLIQEIAFDRPIAREGVYDDSNPRYIHSGDISKFFKGQREPIDQGSYDSLLGMQHGGMIGYQNGDVVQDDAMMQQFLQQQQMMQQGQQQPQQGGNGFVPFDQREPGAAASGSWGEPGAYMNSLKANRDSLQQAAEQARLDSARQSLEAIKLDSLIESIESPKSRYLYDGLGLEGRHQPRLDQYAIMRDQNEHYNSQLMQGRDSSAIRQGVDHGAKPPFMYSPRN